MRPPVVEIVERDHGQCGSLWKNSWQRPDAMRNEVAQITMSLRRIDVRSALRLPMIQVRHPGRHC